MQNTLPKTQYNCGQNLYSTPEMKCCACCTLVKKGFIRAGTAEAPPYIMSVSSEYQMRTSCAFLFKPRAAIPRARLPPVTLASVKQRHYLCNTELKALEQVELIFSKESCNVR